MPNDPRPVARGPGLVPLPAGLVGLDRAQGVGTGGLPANSPGWDTDCGPPASLPPSCPDLFRPSTSLRGFVRARLTPRCRKTWMAGTSPGMTTGDGRRVDRGGRRDGAASPSPNAPANRLSTFLCKPPSQRPLREAGQATGEPDSDGRPATCRENLHRRMRRPAGTPAWRGANRPIAGTMPIEPKIRYRWVTN